MATAAAPGIPVRSRLRPEWTVRACAALHWQAVALASLTTAAAAVFAWLPVAQHHAYNTHAYDLSWFDQLAWNTARGQWLATSFSHGTYLKEHFSPALLVLGLLYRFWSTPETLLITQGVVAAAAAVPLYAGVSRALSSRTAGFIFAAAYLVSPHLHGAILFDFHPDVIAVFFIFLCFAFLQYDRPRAALVALAPAFLIKEDAALIGLGIAVVLWIQHYRRYAVLLVLASVLYMLFAEAVIVLLPHLLHWGTAGEDGRYTYLFHGGMNDPIYLWQHLSGTLQKQALAYIFGSQAMIPLAGLGALIAMPDLLANVLADHKPQLQLTLQYPLFPLALLLIASSLNVRMLIAVRRLQPAWARLHLRADARAPVLAAAVLLAEFVSYLIGSPLGLHVHPARFQTTPHTAALERIVRAVPAKASVSAQSSILPHLSERENIREFPYLDGAAYVIVDRGGFVAWDSGVSGYAAALNALPDRGYCRLRSDDGVELWAVDDLCPPP